MKSPFHSAHSNTVSENKRNQHVTEQIMLCNSPFFGAVHWD